MAIEGSREANEDAVMVDGQGITHHFHSCYLLAWHGVLWDHEWIIPTDGVNSPVARVANVALASHPERQRPTTSAPGLHMVVADIESGESIRGAERNRTVERAVMNPGTGPPVDAVANLWKCGALQMFLFCVPVHGSHGLGCFATASEAFKNFVCEFLRLYENGELDRGKFLTRLSKFPFRDLAVVCPIIVPTSFHFRRSTVHPRLEFASLHSPSYIYCVRARWRVKPELPPLPAVKFRVSLPSYGSNAAVAPCSRFSNALYDGLSDRPRPVGVIRRPFQVPGLNDLIHHYLGQHALGMRWL
ncbi:hypothetical protein FB451DRAFT_1370685 [Mycena latifolia]|nr:hypothetical protein FB451DRAFT_1370685 [Mycena latifolia]